MIYWATLTRFTNDCGGNFIDWGNTTTTSKIFVYVGWGMHNFAGELKELLPVIS
jgi:hypothetical protein